jgi:hypothetical protein
MRILHVILEQGFSGLEACVQLDGQEVLRSDALPSDLMKGFSAQVDVPLDPPGGSGTEQHLVVDLPRADLRLEIPIPAEGDELWVVIRKTPAGLVSEIGTEPRGYM